MKLSITIIRSTIFSVKRGKWYIFERVGLPFLVGKNVTVTPIVFKNEPSWPVRLVQLGTDHSFGPVLIKNTITLSMRLTPIKLADSRSDRWTQLNQWI